MTSSTREFPSSPPARRSALLLVAVASIFALAPLYLLVAWLGAPRQIRYELEGGLLRIVTARGFTGDTKTISLGRIEDVSRVWLRGGELEYGSAKGGYCVGFFRYASLEGVWQATDCSERGVLIKAGGEVLPVVVTPNDPDDFVLAVKEGRVGNYVTPSQPHGVSWWAFATLLLLSWPVALALVVVLYMLPPRLRYRLEADRLEVRAPFLRSSFPLAGARARLHRPLIGERLSGLRLPGWVAGVMVYDEAPTGAYATNEIEGVLLEADERLYITPADRTAFLAALEKTGVKIKKTS